MLEQPSLAIIIDCWENIYQPDQQKLYNKVLQNICDKLKNDKNIRSIAIASYGSSDDEICMDEEFVKKSIQFFREETQWELIRSKWKKTKFVLNNSTHSMIKSHHFRDDQVVFSAYNDIDILFYCNYINSDIKNIYFFGQMWNVCVKSRPVGWKNIMALNTYNLFKTKINLLTDTNCILNSTKLFNTENNWIKFNDNIHIMRNIDQQ